MTKFAREKEGWAYEWRRENRPSNTDSALYLFLGARARVGWLAADPSAGLSDGPIVSELHGALLYEAMMTASALGVIYFTCQTSTLGLHHVLFWLVRVKKLCIRPSNSFFFESGG